MSQWRILSHSCLPTFQAQCAFPFKNTFRQPENACAVPFAHRFNHPINPKGVTLPR
nr:hypothetical protein [uncultured Kingella sp.]